MAKIKFVLTCTAYPEQYDAFMGDVQVGYLRMRHGTFRVDYPDCGGETIYSASPDGDGKFEDHERDKYLRYAADAIQRKLRGEVEKVPDAEYEIER